MMKYIGMRIASKKTKKRKRSRARNTPIMPASRRSVYTTNSLVRRVIDVEAAKAIGTRIAVRSTIGIETPSMPRLQLMPHGSYQTASWTN